MASDDVTVPVLVMNSRKLLGSGSQNVDADGNPLPAPPPPINIFNAPERLSQFAWKYLIDRISARGAETAAIEQMKIDDKHQDLVKTNSNSEFAKTLTRMANALATDKGLARIDPGDDFSGIDSSVHSELCRSDDFIRAFNESSFDDAYIQAYPLNGNEIPSGCYRGCILGSDWKTTMAKFYGMRRTLTFNSWRGKCFTKDDDGVTTVTNRIKLSYGPILNSLLSLQEPIELFRGDVEYNAVSFFDQRATIGLDYSNFNHEFNKFRDEIREVYPGVYIGKMYMMPGLDLFRNEDGSSSLLKIPDDADPQFAMNFMLLAESDNNDNAIPN